ncbi:MAG: AAA family ATPase [Sphingobacteriales bacterium]|nr:MAG: AAA family ATPase [Sphingobacteriales bacterium]
MKAAATGESAIDLSLHRIRLLAKRRVAWLRRVWTEASTARDQAFNYHTEVDGCLDNRDTVAAEQEWYAGEPDMQYLNEELKQTEKKISGHKRARLSQLANIFGLNEAEKNIIEACLALYLDPNLGRVYAYLHDHNGRTYVTRQLVARLFGHGQYLSIGSSSPLFIWRIISETDMGKSEPARIDCDVFIINWLLGINDIDQNITALASAQSLYPAMDHWPVGQTSELIGRLLAKPYRQSVRLFVAGSEGTGRRSFAAAVCSDMRMSLLSVQANRIDAAQGEMLYMYAQRQAWLSDIPLLWQGSFVSENTWPAHIMHYPLQFAAGEANETFLPNEAFTDIRIDLPAAPVDAVYDLCQKMIPGAGQWPKEELVTLIRRHRVSPEQVSSLAKNEIKTIAEVSEALRSASRQQLGNLAQLINSSFTWDDFVIPASLRAGLDDFYFEATERSMVWEDDAIKKYFPQGRGLIGLFTGSPGTGKTMAAQVLANCLQLDLFRIDLSAVVSKYVGETSKNIERVLSRAARMNVVLLFDEADSLFGKRTDVKDAHDRFANTDTNYLLQAIEDYTGIVLLASNRKANIDTGFTRRLRYVLDFPKPDSQQRLQLWSRLR